MWQNVATQNKLCGYELNFGNFFENQQQICIFENQHLNSSGLLIVSHTFTQVAYRWTP